MECVQAIDYPNLVHVVVDNASTDLTPKIIESFLGKRVPIITRRNAETIPMGDNCNAVVRMVPAEAKYFRLLCADDLMAPSAIREKVELAESDDSITVVGCQCRNIGILGSDLPREQNIFDGHAIVRRYLRRETMVFCGTHMLFRCSAINSSRPFYDATITCDDADAAVRETLRGKFGFVHKELAYFRHHEFGHTAVVSKDGTFLFEWLVMLDRYGPQVLTASEYEECRKVYRRFYLRQAILARFRDLDSRLYRTQMRYLDEINDSPKLADFAVALAEWVYLAATQKRHRLDASRSAYERMNG